MAHFDERIRGERRIEKMRQARERAERTKQRMIEAGILIDTPHGLRPGPKLAFKGPDAHLGAVEHEKDAAS